MSYMTSNEQSEMRCKTTFVGLNFVCVTTRGCWRVALRLLNNRVLCLHFEHAVTNVCWRFGFEFCTLRSIGIGVLDLYYERAMAHRFVF